MCNKISAVIVSLLFVLFVGCSSSPDTINNKTSSEPGAKVFIVMNDEGEYEGELLCIDDSTMILCEVYEATEQDLVDSIYTIYTLKNYDINMIKIRFGSNAIYGILLGGFTGALVGLAMTKEDSEKENKPDENNFSFNIDIGPSNEQKLGCCIGGFIGAAVGVIITLSITNDEVVYEQADPEEYDFTKLNIYSRYGGEEPDYLKEIK